MECVPRLASWTGGSRFNGQTRLEKFPWIWRRGAKKKVSLVSITGKLSLSGLQWIPLIVQDSPRFIVDATDRKVREL